MDELFKPVKTVRKVQDNIDRFETLSLKETLPASRPERTKSKVSIVDISSEGSNGTGEPLSVRPSIDSSTSSKSTQYVQPKHKHHESIAFLKKSYLSETPPASLPDDARAILKSQPDGEDLAAVLQYLLYGINRKHDFNVRVPGPKASQIINVLVTVTIPDQWLRLRRSSLSKEDAQLKKVLLSALTSVAGLGALLMQIRQLSSTSAVQGSTLLEDTISVLSSILAGNSVLAAFLSDAMMLFPSESQRRIFWQEVTALFAGSRLLSTMSQVFTTHQDSKTFGASETWLGDSHKYSKWLARNLSTAAILFGTPAKSDDQSMKLLCQVLKRALSLGYPSMPLLEHPCH